MRLISKFCILLVILLALAPSVSAQEYILPLGDNPQLKGIDFPVVKKALIADTLQLPITDDFSYNSVFPDSRIWSDQHAYINYGYAVNPPSYGVATLDALDFNGSVYANATISPKTFSADSLTSQPINLEYPASDSIYLSFFYQPQGNGLEPMPYDSLCLDFYDSDSSQWVNVWRVPGDTLRPFRQVLIPVKDERYLKKGFRFLFRNKASLPLNDDYLDKRGNVDHWNIDYVRLDRNRNYADTILRDVAFSSPLPSMLKFYENMPWNHFEIGYNTLYRPYVILNYFNNDSAIRNVTRRMEIYDELWDELYNPSNASAQDIPPATFGTDSILNNYPFDFSRGETARYKIKAWLRTDDFDNRANDTMYRTQVFRDYFAYDDGSAERAYGLRGQGTANGLIAVRFQSFVADELGGIDIYFTQLKDSINENYYFRLMVWNDFEGKPGELIYEDDIDHSVFYTSSINKFKRFLFKEPVNISSGTYYVGLLQYNQYLLNIGLDINKPAYGNLLYNLGSEWLTSSAPGALMMRPFVMHSYSSSGKQKQLQAEIRVWPNPANDFLRIELPEDTDQKDIRITLYDITGKLVLTENEYRNELFTGALPDGIYLLSLYSKSRVFRTERVIIRH